MTAGDTFLALENVSYSYERPSTPSLKKFLLGMAAPGRTDHRSERVKVFENASLSLKKGDRLGLIGANGAGKTTLLKLMAGILFPDSGRLVSRGRISAVFEIAVGMDFELTGAQNIILRGLYTGMTRAEAHEKMPEIIRFSGLGEVIDWPVRTYSSGMIMRLAFAITTAISPDILLLDEWFLVGDRDFYNQACERLNMVVDNAGILVLASHIVPVIAENCTQAILLDGHGIAAHGPVDEVIRLYEKRGHG